MLNIKLTDNAIEKANQYLAEEINPDLKLRVFVVGGGCSGLTCGFTFADEVQKDDFSGSFSGLDLVVDGLSFQYLEGAIIDFKSDFEGSRFTIDIPNAESSCSCGESFSI